ncbi:MAG TPA: cation-translocating P-type ATPase family protein, partial [Acidobacteriota bacterium]
MFFPLAHSPQLEESEGFGWRFAGLILAGLALVAYWQQWVRAPFQWDLGIALTFIFGYRTFVKSFQDALGRRISADQAVTIAALAALYVGQYLAAAEVVYIMLVGETLEEYAAGKFHSDLKRLLSCLPHEASVVRDGAEQKVHLEEIKSGEKVLVYPGGRVPVDGTILEGESLIDESSITGESLPREHSVGDSVYAGTLNQTGRLVVEALRVGEATALSRIVQLVRHAKENKAPIQRVADRYARWFLPLVLGIAAVCYLLTRDWMRAISILIVACPCPMVLATPAAVLASISYLARRGIIVKGGIYLERLAQVNCVAFDKTGTLTLGRPELVEIISLDRFRENEVLAWAASLECQSEHLLAGAIRGAAGARSLALFPVESVQRHAGLGMEGILRLSKREGADERAGEGESGRAGDNPSRGRQGADERAAERESGRAGARVMVGSARFIEQQGLELSGQQKEILKRVAAQSAIPILVTHQDRLAGVIILRDGPRPEAARAVHDLHQLGIHKTVLLTGDNPSSAHRVANAVGISEVHADLLPEEKLERLHELKQQGYTVAMVGDGVNDSPSLAAADVGIAMGDTGTDIAAEASGVVFMGQGGLDRLAELVRSSRRTLKTIQDNILWFGLVFNLGAVLAAFFGYLSAVAAALVHQGSSFAVLMNSLKLLRGRPVSILPHRLQHAAADFKHQYDHWRPAPSLHHLSQRFYHWLDRHKHEIARAGLIAAPLLYILSGVTIIAPDEAGIRQRFGRVLEQPLSPGIHYVLPWPMERLYRVQPARVNSIELGFRTGVEIGGTSEPVAYEWNIQHRQGRYIRQQDEALMVTGDEYLVEVNAVVQYSIQDPKRYLFRMDELESALRAVSEGSLRYVVGFVTLDQVLALDRRDVERLAAEMLRREAARLDLGVAIHSVSLQDVHPALEVVSAFREVASALEEKNRIINQAQAYANERIPLARGEAAKRL